MRTAVGDLEGQPVPVRRKPWPPLASVSSSRRTEWPPTAGLSETMVTEH